jgi:hypothetical protein
VSTCAGSVMGTRQSATARRKILSLDVIEFLPC